MIWAKLRYCWQQVAVLEVVAVADQRRKLTLVAGGLTSKVVKDELGMNLSQFDELSWTAMRRRGAGGGSLEN